MMSQNRPTAWCMYQSMQSRGGLSSTARSTKCPLCVRSKYSKLPSVCPTKRSKSPSPSQSDMKGLMWRVQHLCWCNKPWPLAASMWRTVQAIPAAVIVHILCLYEAKWICITTPVPPKPGWNVSRMGKPLAIEHHPMFLAVLGMSTPSTFS